MKTEVSAPGKVFLSGEYFVLDGSLATILSTKQRAKITIEENSGHKNILYSLTRYQILFLSNYKFQAVILSGFLGPLTYYSGSPLGLITINQDYIFFSFMIFFWVFLISFVVCACVWIHSIYV